MLPKSQCIIIMLISSIFASCNYLEDNSRYPGYKEAINENAINLTNGIQSDSIQVIKVPDEKISKLNYDDYVYSSKIVTLESTSKSQIGNIDKIFFDKNSIIIVDKKITKSVFIFDTTGKYINKITTQNVDKQSGMKHFFTATYDRLKKRIILYDDKEICLYFFDIFGTFIKKENTYFSFSDFSLIPSSGTFAYLTLYKQNRHISKLFGNDLILGDSVNSVKTVLIRDSANLPELEEKLYNLNNLCFSGKNLFFTPMFSNLTYLISSSNTILSRYYFQFPGKSINKVLKERGKMGVKEYLDLLSTGKYYGFSGTILEADGNLFVEIEKGRKIGYFYNKKSRNIIGGNLISHDDKYHLNNLAFFKYPFCSNGNEFVSVLYRQDFRYLEISANTPKKRKIISQLSKHFNPTLLIFKLKEF